ncbi:GNAT family N-acetyltransferase [Ferrimonas marina]|nr:GNAT family N-acetyltransferase [Ferrimonas marina]
MRRTHVFFSTPNLLIRSCAEEDIGWLGALLSHADPDATQRLMTLFETQNLQTMSDRLLDLPAGAYLLVALGQGGDPIGALFSWPCTASRFQIEMILEPEQRGRGLGSEFLRAWSHQFQQHHGTTSLQIVVPQGFPCESSLFTSVGFVCCGEVDGHKVVELAAACPSPAMAD